MSEPPPLALRFLKSGVGERVGEAAWSADEWDVYFVAVAAGYA